MKHFTQLRFLSTALALAFSGCVAEIGGNDENFVPKDQLELVETIQERTCASDDVLAQQIAVDPEREATMAEIEAHTENAILTRSLLPDGSIAIPVVVHVVHRTASENISDAQIQSQIDVLNRDFRRTNTDANNIWAQATDANIEFRLMGVSRTSTTKNGFGTNDSIKFTAQGGRDVHQPSNYLNMWVGNIGGGILGYAQFPGGSASTDGVVMDYRYFGTTGTATAPFDLGRTATHEVGHWLNLRHIWGDNSQCGSGTTGGDFVSDTPAARAPNYGCPTVDSCTGDSRDMVENYMDYSDDSCMNLFTLGQKVRMQALFASGGARQSLVNAPLTPVNFGGTTPPPAPQYQVIDTRSAQAAATGAQTTYGPYSAVGRTAIKFEIAGGTGDADLYVRFGSAPTEAVYDCRPFATGNTEKCEFSPSQSGSYFVMIDAFAAYSGVTLTVSAAGGTAPTPEVCTDGVDNDQDGNIDCNDSDCATAAACQTPDPEVCTDGVDNDQDGNIDCDDSDCATDASCIDTGAVTLSSANFETSFGPYTDGGTDSRRVTSTNCAFGSCIELRDDTTTSKITLTNALNLSAFNEFQIDFTFKTASFESGEVIIVEYSSNGGSTWSQVARYIAGTNFNNNTLYGASIPLTRSTATFSSNAKIRIRVDASADDDVAFFDDVVIIAQ